MTQRKSHPSIESRKKNERVYVLLDRGTRDRLKLVASAQGRQLVDLLGDVAEREIKAWERLSGVTVEKLLAGGEKLMQGKTSTRKGKPAKSRR